MPEEYEIEIVGFKEEYDTESALNTDISPLIILKNVIIVLVSVGLLLSAVFFGIKVFNPKQKSFIYGTTYAYKIIQDELIPYYKQRGYVYKSKNEKIDKFCKLLGEKYSENPPDCINIGGILKTNFTFKNKKISIIGMEKPPYKKGDILVKDFIIDINGEGVGEDEFGADRVPVRIYSTGRMGGLLSPINCSRKDIAQFGADYPAICHNAPEINFMATNIPFGYDVFQIGGDKGNTRAIIRDVSFLRADCSAFGGDMAGLNEYCSQKGFYWNKDCYKEFECSVKLAETKL